MKIQIHKHDNNAEYKSQQTNLRHDEVSNKMVHESIESMPDEKFESQIENAKLIRVFHSPDERTDVKQLVTNLSLRNWSDDVQVTNCSNGNIRTAIRKVARVVIDDSGNVGRFAPSR